MSRQQGAALLIMVAIIVLGAAYLLISHLNAASGFVGVRREQNAKVLNLAKQALIGYVAQNAALTTENNPGRLPCPEAPGNYGTANEGQAAGNCTLPAVGRFPWRTLGLDKLTDAAGEPLWYVVGAGWTLPNSGALLTINSNSTGGLTVDGVANDSVALIIAPGPAFSVPAAAGCAAWSQSRSTAGAPDLRNYLECDNATLPADATFVTGGPTNSFNDQILRVTAADLLPGIEAAVAHRIERDIVPQLRDVYAGPNWGLAAGDRVFPYAATFADPETSSFSGASGVTQGLLPATYSSCTAGPADPRCVPSFTTFDTASTPSFAKTSGLGIVLYSNCDYLAGAPTYAYCWGEYVGGAAQIQMDANVRNVAMSLRRVNAAVTPTLYYFDIFSVSWVNWSGAASVTLNSSGTARVRSSGTIPGLPYQTFYYIMMGDDIIADHALLDSTTVGAGAAGWLTRNQWHKFLYYAMAPGYAASSAAPRSCADSGAITCVQVANLLDPTKQRAVLALTGRALKGQARPSGSLLNWLDSAANSDAADLSFEQLKVGAASNDRFISISKNP